MPRRDSQHLKSRRQEGHETHETRHMQLFCFLSLSTHPPSTVQEVIQACAWSEVYYGRYGEGEETNGPGLLLLFRTPYIPVARAFAFASPNVPICIASAPRHRQH